MIDTSTARADGYLNRTPATTILLTALLLMLSLVVAPQSAEAALEGPTLLLTNAKKGVEYDGGNGRWRKVRRNKLMYAGSRIRTSTNGSASIVLKGSGALQRIQPGSEILVEEDGVKLLSGALSEPDTSHGDLLASLNKRFSDAQMFTVTRRSSKDSKAKKLRPANRIVLAATWPTLMWENTTPDTPWMLTINGNTHTLPASNDSVVKTRLEMLQPGTHHYAVAAGSAPSSDRTSHQEMIWLDADKEAALKKRVTSMESLFADEPYLKGIILEEAGLLTAAFEIYDTYLKQHPDENDVRALLIRTCDALGLTTRKHAESERYNEQVLMEEFE
ncbi:MAG: hypothetical protein HQL50_11700 [Magnetococcales bacterium]|nr:hypothetical protein [Magnetococcales bacterium]